MPEYVYGCNENIEHPTKDVHHGFDEEPDMVCDECGAPMHRIPQPLSYAGVSPQPNKMVRDWLHRRSQEKRAGKKQSNKREVKWPDRT